MKILFVLACLVFSGSAQYSRFFPYWVEKELNWLPDAIGTNEESQTPQVHEPNPGQQFGELNKSVEDLFSKLRLPKANRQRYYLYYFCKI